MIISFHRLQSACSHLLCFIRSQDYTKQKIGRVGGWEGSPMKYKWEFTFQSCAITLEINIFFLDLYQYKNPLS